jgi:hypothetical protein
MITTDLKPCPWLHEAIEAADNRARLAAMHRRAQRAESEVARLRRQLNKLLREVARIGRWARPKGRRVSAEIRAAMSPPVTTRPEVSPSAMPAPAVDKGGEEVP